MKNRLCNVVLYATLFAAPLAVKAADKAEVSLPTPSTAVTPDSSPSAIASELTAGLMSSQRRVELTGRLWSTWLGVDSYISAADPDELFALVRLTSGYLDSERRQLLASRLVNRFAGNDQALAQLPPGRFVLLRRAMLDLGAGEQARADWVATYVSQGQAWRATTAEDLTQLLAATPIVRAAGGPTEQAKQTLIQHAMAVQFLPQAIGKVDDRAARLCLAAAVGLRATKQQRESLRTTIEAELLIPSKLAAINVDELAQLRPVLAALHAPPDRWGQVLDHWLEVSNWKSALSAAQLSRLLTLAADVPVAQRQVVDAATAYVSEPVPWVEGGAADLLALLTVLGPRLDDGPRRELLSIVTLHINAPQAVARIAPEQLPSLRSAILALGPRGDALGTIWGAWLESHSDWLMLPPERFNSLLGTLDAKRFPSLREAQDRVLSRLLEPGFLRRISLKGLATLAPAVGRCGSGTDANTGAVTGPGTDLLRTMCQAWLDSHPDWRKASADELVTLAQTFDSVTFPALGELQGQVLSALREPLSRAYVQTQDSQSWSGRLAELGPALGRENRGKLQQDLRAIAQSQPKALQALTPAQILALLTAIKGPLAVSQDGFAMLQVWAQAGSVDIQAPDTAYQPLWELAKAANPKAADALQAMLVDAPQRLNLRMAFLLGYGRQAPNEIVPWNNHLDEAGSAKELDADNRALYLLARAQAEEIKPTSNPEDPVDPLRGLPWVEKALGQAEGEPVRFLALGWIVDRLLAVQEFGRAESLLQSVGGQFETHAMAARVADLQRRVALGKQDETRRQTKLAHRLAVDELRIQQKHLEQKLDEARRNGRPADDIASLERMVQNVSANLGEIDY